jgi:NTP pyrophosphatase (non-canonical NTP hydrolase)
VFGTGCDGRIEVEGVGQVELAVDARRTGERDLLVVDVEAPAVCRGPALLLGLVGVEPGPGCGELGTRELRHQWSPVPGDHRPALGAVDVRRVVDGIRWMQVGPLRGGPQDRRLVPVVRASPQPHRPAPHYRDHMDCDDYQRAALRTARDRDAPDEFLHLVLGLVGEAGEIAEKVKKLIRDHHSDLGQLDRDDMAAELGDVLWYAAVLASFLGLSLDDVARRNIDKLADRQRRAVLGGSGDNR